MNIDCTLIKNMLSLELFATEDLSELGGIDFTLLNLEDHLLGLYLSQLKLFNMLFPKVFSSLSSQFFFFFSELSHFAVLIELFLDLCILLNFIHGFREDSIDVSVRIKESVLALLLVLQFVFVNGNIGLSTWRMSMVMMAMSNSVCLC